MAPFSRKRASENAKCSNEAGMDITLELREQISVVKVV